MKDLLRYGRAEAARLSAVLSLALAGIAVEVVRPWPLKLIVDNVLARQPLRGHWAWLGAWSPTAQLAWLATAAVVLVAGGQLLRLLQSQWQADVGVRLGARLGADVFRHLLRLSPCYHARQRVGDLVRRVTTDANCVRDLFLWVGLLAVTSAVSLVAMWLVMWRLDAGLSLVALAVVPVLVLVVWRFAKPMAERTHAQYEFEGDIMALAEETLTAMPMVQAFGREEHEQERFDRLSRRTVAASVRAVTAQLQFSLTTRAVMAAGTASLMGLGGWQVHRGTLTLGGLLVFLAYLAAWYAPLETLVYLSTGIASVTAGARRVREVLAADEVVAEPRQPQSPSAGRTGEVEFEEVSFGYVTGRPVLQQVSLRARLGEIIALVGPTGAGKSTLVGLIPRLFDPWTGSVRIAGLDARQWRLAELRAQLAMVPQESWLWPVSVADNIRVGRPDASLAEVRAAATAARADEFIQRLPEGYDTVLGERGATLSGGERQRLGLARAFLKNAPIWILDEPTAALDAATEQAVLATLEHLRGERTVFMIAHRPATAQYADRVVVLEQGRLRERT